MRKLYSFSTEPWVLDKNLKRRNMVYLVEYEHVVKLSVVSGVTQGQRTLFHSANLRSRYLPFFSFPGIYIHGLGLA